MSRRLMIAFASMLLLAFGASAAYTMAQATPGCQKCRKEGCPQGYCYVDCVSCCYNDPRLGLVCFK
jgi:hypothetical protein